MLVALAALQHDEKGLTMITLTNRHKLIACIAVWLIVSFVILAGSFRFSSDDWWWTTTYCALIAFATVFTALLYTSRPGSGNADQSSRAKRDVSEPEAMSTCADNSIVRLATASNPQEASLWQQALESEGVRCRIVGDMLGSFEVAIQPEIWVFDSDLDQARAVLKEQAHWPEWPLTFLQ